MSRGIERGARTGLENTVNYGYNFRFRQSPVATKRDKQNRSKSINHGGADTKSREFQYKLLHRYLATNDFLNKIGISSSPRCSLCDGADESLEHLFVSCLITQSFWAEVIKWCSNRGVVINHLSAKDILFGIKVHKDNLFINHILLVGKQYIYNCRCTKTNPCLRVFLARLNNVYQLETIIAKSKNKMSFHLSKWQALLTGGTQLPTNTC